MQGKDRHQLIAVRYRNEREGSVDSVTLNQLVEAKRISHFYRPSEDRWVDMSVDPLRRRGETKKTGRLRRASDWEESNEKEEKPRGLFARFLRLKRRPPAPQELRAQACFRRGFVLLETTDDCEGAVRAFARSIQLDPAFEWAYVERALAYERLGNLQQAIEDYSSALLLNPSDAKIYYMRGLVFRRLAMDVESVADLTKAADLHFWPANDLLESLGISA